MLRATLCAAHLPSTARFVKSVTNFWQQVLRPDEDSCLTSRRLVLGKKRNSRSNDSLLL